MGAFIVPDLLSSLGLVALPAGAARERGRDGKAGSGPSVASAPVQNRAAIIAGGVAAAAAVAYGLLRRRAAASPPVAAPEEPAGPDPRAESLREKLAASRELAAERDAFEEAETPVDEAVAVESGRGRRGAPPGRARARPGRRR